jgi:hypothetical protein
MRNECCRSRTPKGAEAGRTRKSMARRVLSWIVPSLVLAAMQKCPPCLAAYVALFTGFGISLAVAKFAWWSIGIGCLIVLVYVATTTALSFIRLH